MWIPAAASKTKHSIHFFLSFSPSCSHSSRENVSGEIKVWTLCLLQSINVFSSSSFPLGNEHQRDPKTDDDERPLHHSLCAGIIFFLTTRRSRSKNFTTTKQQGLSSSSWCTISHVIIIQLRLYNDLFATAGGEEEEEGKKMRFKSAKRDQQEKKQQQQQRKEFTRPFFALSDRRSVSMLINKHTKRWIISSSINIEDS